MPTALSTSASSPAGPSHVDTREPHLPIGPLLASLAGLAVFTTIQLLFAYRTRGMTLEASEAVLSGLATWMPWAVLGPLIFLLCRQFPFEGRRWVSSFLVHLPASFVVGILWSAIRWGFSYIPWVDERPLVFSKVAMAHLYLWFLSYWVLVGVHEAWHNYQRFKQGELRATQLEARLAHAQLEVLKGQLHPHFLFNTLHAISTLIHRDAGRGRRDARAVERSAAHDAREHWRSGGAAAAGARVPATLPRHPADAIPGSSACRRGCPAGHAGCPCAEPGAPATRRERYTPWRRRAAWRGARRDSRADRRSVARI